MPTPPGTSHAHLHPQPESATNRSPTTSTPTAMRTSKPFSEYWRAEAAERPQSATCPTHKTLTLHERITKHGRDSGTCGIGSIGRLDRLGPHRRRPVSRPPPKAPQVPEVLV